MAAMSEPMPDAPFVSVIVPCRNEAAFIRRFVESLLQNDYPREKLEIKFVDGLSTDGTKEFLLEAARQNPIIEVLDNPRMIVPAAMNLAIRRSRGEYIVRMDAHAEYPKDYIARVVRLLRETRAGNAGGSVMTVPNGQGGWARAVAYVTAHPFGVGNSAWRLGRGRGFVDTVPNGVFPRAVLDKVGLFDERLTRGQDHELNARIRAVGYKVAFDPRIRIRYYNQGSLRGLVRQGFYTSMWNLYNLSLHPYTWRWRRFVPSAFVMYLVALPWTLTPVTALPLALYVALVARFAWRGRRSGGALRVAGTFAAYHLSYGAGTYFGLVNLLTGRWRRYLGRPLKR